MSNLTEYAENELRKIGMMDSGEPYNDSVAKSILDLIELFASQGHTGFTAPYTIRVFKRLAMFQPLAPLTGEDEEWEVTDLNSVQNKRCSTVFKDKDGRAYDIRGKVFSDDGGETWFTNRDSWVDITFPYTVPDEPERVYLNKADKKSKE